LKLLRKNHYFIPAAGTIFACFMNPRGRYRLSIRFNQNLAFKAVVLKSAAQKGKKPNRFVSVEPSGGKFIASRASQASSFTPFRLNPTPGPRKHHWILGTVPDSIPPI
jgi:hypothetical protein